MPNASPPPAFVSVIKTEEKGSDVNLATYLLADAFREDEEAFMVISHDSTSRNQSAWSVMNCGQSSGESNPHPRQSQALLNCRPTFVKQIRPAVLEQSQFPARIPGPG